MNLSISKSIDKTVLASLSDPPRTYPGQIPRNHRQQWLGKITLHMLPTSPTIILFFCFFFLAAILNHVQWSELKILSTLPSCVYFRILLKVKGMGSYHCLNLDFGTFNTCFPDHLSVRGDKLSNVLWRVSFDTLMALTHDKENVYSMGNQWRSLSISFD